ncbi:MAG: hypothetical protein ACRC6B_05570 [Fusobacteriaceae bacterium]
MKRLLDLEMETHNRGIQDLKREHVSYVANLMKHHEMEITRLKAKHKEEIKNTHIIRWDESKKYFNLTDFCRNLKGLLFIKESEIKQYLLQTQVVKIENDNYVGNGEESITVDGELYISNEQLRKIILLRSLIFIGDDSLLDEAVNMFKENRDLVIEQMANTVYVKCKHKSEEFKAHRENVHYLNRK